ncbi:MAG TPA: TetR/AcrR family transcriptional regulator [Candidatus Acidoferrales bacterium]|nr:TetR/AcrR family transcriptional regulator [Candidatus Acidoferrales bacterium]
MSVRKSKSPPRRKPVAVRARALRAAERIFARHGYGATSMRDVAAAAGIQAASLYHHWRSKEALYADVLDEANGRLREIVRAELGHDEPLAEQLRRVIGRVLGFYLQQPDLARLNLRATLGDGLPKSGRMRSRDTRWLGLVEGFLQPLEARGQVKPVDLTRFLLSASAVLSVHAVAYHDRRNPFRRELAGPNRAAETTEHVTEVILRILGLE